MKTIKILSLVLLAVLLFSCQKDELLPTVDDSNNTELLLNKTFVSNTDTLIFNENKFIILSDYGTYVEWSYANNDSTYNIVNKSIVTEYTDWSYDNKYLTCFNNNIRYVFQLTIYDEYIIFRLNNVDIVFNIIQSLH